MSNHIAWSQKIEVAAKHQKSQKNMVSIKSKITTKLADSLSRRRDEQKLTSKLAAGV